MNGLSQEKTELEVKDWLIILIVAGIPCIGTMVLLMWASSSAETENITRSKFSKAYLILTLGGIY